MKIFVDINVLLDFYLGRTPNYRYVSKIIKSYIKNNRLYYNCYISSHTISTLLYCLHSPKIYNNANYKISDDIIIEFTNLTLRLFEIIPENKGILYSATNSQNFRDKEDAIQYECAKVIQADLILTSNIKDFKVNDITIMTPEEFCNRYSRFF